MSSDGSSSTGTAVHCRWPGCQSRFTGAPHVTGWRKISITPELPLVLCPFHAVEHIPSVTMDRTGVTAVCSCHGMLPLTRDSAATAMRDWRAHAREINGPERSAICAECLREFELRPDGMVRRHNAFDKRRGRLLATLCPGAEQPPREPVHP